MIQNMSKKEVKKTINKWNNWFINLDFNTKSNIYNLTNNLLEQANCNHDWIDPNTYENDLDKTKQFCSNCNLVKPL